MKNLTKNKTNKDKAIREYQEKIIKKLPWKSSNPGLVKFGPRNEALQVG